MTITGILEGKGTLRAGQTAMQLQTLSEPQSPLHSLRRPARGGGWEAGTRRSQADALAHRSAVM